MVLLLAAAFVPSYLLARWLTHWPFGWLAEAVLATSLIAQKSLKDHVLAVYDGLGRSLAEGRQKVSLIVGRDPAQLDEAGVAKAALESLVAEHSYWHSRMLGGGPPPTAEERMTRRPARHQLVHLHEPSGRKALYIASHVCGIVGWSADRTKELVSELMAFATRPEFVYRHPWRRGDVLVWDNLCTMHRATEFDDRSFKRDVRRTTCRERTLSREGERIS